MRSVVLVALFALIAAASAQYTRWGIVRVQPSISAAPGANINGWIYFDSNSTHTKVIVNVDMTSTYASRELGIHIHQFGDIVTNANATHFDPGNTTFGTHWQGAGATTFGCPETNTFPNYRAGCLGNWVVGADGLISMEKEFPIAQFGPTSSYTAGAMSSPIGLGMLIHAAVDPCNGTSTLYGARLAGGVIGSANGALQATAYTTGKSQIVATCRIVGTTFAGATTNNIRGKVYFRQTAANTNSIEVRAVIEGTDLGASAARSLHIHDFGDLSDMVNGTRTGGHWNPRGANHSIPNGEPRHSGDLGRITVVSNNMLYYSYMLSSLNASNAIYHPLLFDPESVLGRGMIFHAGRDEGCAAPTTNGNAGARWGQCVIGLARDEVWATMEATWPTGLTMPAQIGNLACSAPVNQPPPPVNQPAPSAGVNVPRAAPKASAAAVVPSVLAVLLAAFALLF